MNVRKPKRLLFLALLFCSLKTYSQELNDKIFTKEGDSILCKITLVKPNWIYYDHIGKKGIRNDYIHMSDIKSYVYNGVKKKAYEYEATLVILQQIKDTIPKDTIRTFYLDSLNKKQICFLLLNKNKQVRQISQYKKIEIIDSVGKFMVLFPNQIAGYWLNGIFYKTFEIMDDGKKNNFFAEELTTGKVSLYLYNGDQLKNKSIYIFKKYSEDEFKFVEEGVSKKTVHGETSGAIPQAKGKPSGLGPISFDDEQLYLNCFKSYLSDCNEVKLKFSSNWYTRNDVITMFRDYNACK